MSLSSFTFPAVQLALTRSGAVALSCSRASVAESELGLGVTVGKPRDATGTLSPRGKNMIVTMSDAAAAAAVIQPSQVNHEPNVLASTVPASIIGLGWL